MSFQNPLEERFSREFFLKIPDRPGVYRFLDEDGQLLYVGKAKSLKNRLNSYRHYTSKQISRKLQRLLRLIRQIEWEEQSSEREALFRENVLLRSLKPPFNRMNKNPENYLYLRLRPWSRGLEIRLQAEQQYEAHLDWLDFGAFRAKRQLRELTLVLARGLWWVQEKNPPPPHWNRERSPKSLNLLFSSDWSDTRTSLIDFLKGESTFFLNQLRTQKASGFDAFLHEKDTAALEQAFKSLFQKTAQIRELFGIQSPTLSAFELDDLLIHYREIRCKKPLS